MASYFNLVLDTTAPSGLALAINGGAQYTTTTAVSLTIGISDSVTTGYQMKIWGTSTASSEALATWETYTLFKNVTLTGSDGLKTIYGKVRDGVGNETSIASASITLDTAVPTVTITGPDVSTISKIATFDTSAFSFVSDIAFVEYKVKVVPTANSLQDAGYQIPTTGGSTNMSGIGAFGAAETINCTIKGADLEAASSGDGTKIVKIFIKSASGTWSVV